MRMHTHDRLVQYTPQKHRHTDNTTRASTHPWQSDRKTWEKKECETVDAGVCCLCFFKQNVWSNNCMSWIAARCVCAMRLYHITNKKRTLHRFQCKDFSLQIFISEYFQSFFCVLKRSVKEVKKNRFSQLRAESHGKRNSKQPKRTEACPFQTWMIRVCVYNFAGAIPIESKRSTRSKKRAAVYRCQYLRFPLHVPHWNSENSFKCQTKTYNPKCTFI